MDLALTKMMDVFRKRSTIVVIVLLLSCVVFYTCTTDNRSNEKIIVTHENGMVYAGSQTCSKCHQDIYATHLKTAHFNTSALASDSSIHGSFEEGKNKVVINPQMSVVMEKKDGKFLQSGFFNGDVQMIQPFDLVIGSGTKGQSYLFWYQNILYQLPVSYFASTHSWVNSPGYPQDQVLFNRSIPGRCLECHGTSFKRLSGDKFPVEYDRNEIILGIDCERCHGPAQRHVDFHTASPQEKNPRFIVNAARIGRQQQLDACALCHSGLRKSLKPTFSFIVGDTLENYSDKNYDTTNLEELDVHGNQYGLLTASKCFRNSDMTCSSCHNTHVNERGNKQLFSNRCQQCHSAEKHSFCKFKEDPEVLKKNCVDCHMPESPSKVLNIRLAANENAVPNMVRTHLVDVYLKNNNSK